MGKLTLNFCNKKHPTGDYSDGENLYLRVTTTGRKSWIFRKMIEGKLLVRALGPYKDNSRTSDSVGLTLYEAREAARSIFKTVYVPKVQLKNSTTFSDYTHRYIKAHSPRWTNAKHKDQWVNTLSEYAQPVIGNLILSQITVKHLRAILDPIWSTKNETASRVRQRIEKIIDYGNFLEEANRSNPARWRGHLELIYHKRKAPTHFYAIDYLNLPGIIPKAFNSGLLSGLCLTWICLHACRSNESRGARWHEIDLQRNIWKIPSARTKTKKELINPLSNAAILILNRVKAMIGEQEYIFQSINGPLSDVALSKQFKKFCDDERATVHGLRSCFRDWAAEKTNHSREAAEAQLGHALGTVEAAYFRSDLLEKRRLLLQDWAAFILPKTKTG